MAILLLKNTKIAVRRPRSNFTKIYTLVGFNHITFIPWATSTSGNFVIQKYENSCQARSKAKVRCYQNLHTSRV